MPVNQPIMMGAHTGHGAVCMNCGYVRVHVAEIVKIWLSDHPEEADIGEIKADIKELRSEMKSELKDVHSDLKDLRKDMQTDFRVLFAALIAVALGLAGVMAKGFHWL